MGSVSHLVKFSSKDKKTGGENAFRTLTIATVEWHGADRGGNVNGTEGKDDGQEKERVLTSLTEVWA